MAVSLSTPLITIHSYLKSMQQWLLADITTYKNQFSPSIAIGPNDFTKAPSILYVQPTSSPQGYLSIPIASSILSSMEFCGYCLRGNWKDSSKSEKNIKAFYRTIKPHITSNFPTDAEIRVLILSCRHGFAHKFFPKHDINVHYNGFSNALFENSHGYTLNTNALINHVTQGLNFILSESSLHPKMENCLHNYITYVENRTPLPNKQNLFQQFYKKLLHLFKS